MFLTHPHDYRTQIERNADRRLNIEFVIKFGPDLVVAWDCGAVVDCDVWYKVQSESDKK